MGKGIEKTKGDTEVEVDKKEGRELRKRKNSGGLSKTDYVATERHVGIMMTNKYTTVGIHSKAFLTGGHSASAYVFSRTDSSLFFKAA